MRDRARGSLVGLAIGDALGAPTEGLSAAQIAAQFGAVTDLQPGAIGTDDTEYAVLTAFLLLEHGKSLTSDDVAEGWRQMVAGQGSLFRAGFSEITSLDNLRRGLRPPESGIRADESWSDGAAMRAASHGIFARGDVALARSLASTDAQVSHSRDGVWCAEAIAAAVTEALAGVSVDALVDTIVDVLPADSWSRRVAVRALDLTKDRSFDEVPDVLESEIAIPWYPWADAAPESLGIVVSLLRAGRGDFRRTVLAAVNLGRDSDTNAAVLGALLGGVDGYEALPVHWREAVRTVHGSCVRATAGCDLVEIADRLIGQGA